MNAAQRAGMRIVALPEPDYPPLLKHIDTPPPILYMKGDASLAARKCVAIVGSRSASGAGRQFAAALARDLGAAGVTVVSGLARGIDTAAHEAALTGGTIAVVAGGVDMIYPPENAALHAELCERGLIVSECPLGYSPRGQDFPRRNRIISGLSLGVVVVEAARQSGSLITARLALEQNRDVFAVPGHPLDPRASGTNNLIRSGARLITCADDVLSELPHDVRTLAGSEWGMRENTYAKDDGDGFWNGSKEESLFMSQKAEDEAGASSPQPAYETRKEGAFTWSNAHNDWTFGGEFHSDSHAFSANDGNNSDSGGDYYSDNSGSYPGDNAYSTYPNATPAPGGNADDNINAAHALPSAADREKVLNVLSIVPITADAIARLTGLSASALAVALLELDLYGSIERHGNEGISIKTNADC
jgi:DNA protecting protein DprA